MAIQTFTAAQVLTAAQMNSLQANDYNQTVSAKVASYTLVAADKGTRITMSNAAATTITVNTSLFAAGDSLRIQNIGAGACTITAGTATVTSAGPLAVAQWGGGQLFFTSASAAIWFPDAVTASAAALVCVKATTAFTTVSSFTADSVFTSTYDSYLILLQGTIATIDNVYMRFRTGGVDNSASNYNYVFTYGSNTGTTSSGGTAATTFLYLPDMGTTMSGFQITVQTPATAVPTTIAAFGNRGASHQYLTSGSNTASTAFDGFKIYSAGGYNMTGTYTIYGYSKTV